jgi:hypothetical protein
MVKAAVTEFELQKAEALFGHAAAGGCESISGSAAERMLAESIVGFWSPELIRSALTPPGAGRPDPAPGPAVEGRRVRLP